MENEAVCTRGNSPRSLHPKVLLFGILSGAVLSVACVFAKEIKTSGAVLLQLASYEVLKGDDALSVDPKHYHLEFENDRTRVLALALGPNETVDLHDDPDTLFVCVSDSCHIRLKQPDGYTGDFHFEDAGETRWIQGHRRSEKNIGKERLEMVLVEFKNANSSARNSRQ